MAGWFAHRSKIRVVVSLTSVVSLVAILLATVQATAQTDHGLQPIAFGLDHPVDDAYVEAVLRTKAGEHWISVDRTTATVTLFVGKKPQAIYAGKIGEDRSTDGFYATAIGTYRVYSMSDDLAPTSFYDGGYLTDWVGFDPDRFNGFHSPVRDAIGDPFPNQNQFTKGCVRLSEGDAQAVYDFASMGMRVEVHE